MTPSHPLALAYSDGGTTETRPVRIQRSRAKGSRLVSPNGLPIMCVSRPSKWGNPYVPGVNGVRDKLHAVQLYHEWMCGACKYPLSRWERDRLRDDLHELRGKNLACWCGEGPCHADVLLQLANRGFAALPHQEEADTDQQREGER